MYTVTNIEPNAYWKLRDVRRRERWEENEFSSDRLMLQSSLRLKPRGKYNSWFLEQMPSLLYGKPLAEDL